jgi:hypothetical protein
MVELSIVQIATRLTTLPVLFLSAAWVTVSQGILIGGIFLCIAGFVAVIIIEISGRIELERIKQENWGKP